MMRRLSELRREDTGMTLVETLIAVVLLAVVVALSTGFLTFVLDQQSNITQSSDATRVNQAGMERITRIVRQGVYPTGSSANSTIIQSATPTQLVIASRLSATTANGVVDGTIRKYTFTLTGTTLYVQQADLVSCTSAGVCTWGTASAQKPLFRGVQNTGGTSVCPANTANTDGPFHYVYLDPSTNLPTTVASPTAAQIPTITYVTINFFTQTQTGPHKPACVALTDYVQMRNKA